MVAFSLQMDDKYTKTRGVIDLKWATLSLLMMISSWIYTFKFVSHEPKVLDATNPLWKDTFFELLTPTIHQLAKEQGIEFQYFNKAINRLKDIDRDLFLSNRKKALNTVNPIHHAVDNALRDILFNTSLFDKNFSLPKANYFQDFSPIVGHHASSTQNAILSIPTLSPNSPLSLIESTKIFISSLRRSSYRDDIVFAFSPLDLNLEFMVYLKQQQGIVVYVYGALCSDTSPVSCTIQLDNQKTER
jgi:hypothetical protein